MDTTPPTITADNQTNCTKKEESSQQQAQNSDSTLRNPKPKPVLAGHVNDDGEFVKIRLCPGESQKFMFVDTVLDKQIPVWYHLPKTFKHLAPELELVYEHDTATAMAESLNNKDDDDPNTHADSGPEDTPVDDVKEDADIRRQQQEQQPEDIIKIVSEFMNSNSLFDKTNNKRNSTILNTITEAFSISKSHENPTTITTSTTTNNDAKPSPQTIEQRTTLMESSDSQILFVMHGCMRNGGSYVKTWAPLAERYNILVLCPQFSSSKFPEYNTGHMFDRATGKPNSREQWLFSSIERLFDALNLSGLKRTRYHMFGHSAGAQFVCRMTLFCPESRMESAIAANAGWYTLPTFDEDYPYGLFRSGLTRDTLSIALSRRLTLLLGQEDNKVQNMRQTRRAMSQGPTRFDRGVHCYLKARTMAEMLGVTLQWTMKTVPGTGHWHRPMAVIAVREFGFSPFVNSQTSPPQQPQQQPQHEGEIVLAKF